MSYVRKVLQPNETLLYTTGLHWLTYLPSISLFVLAVVLAVGAIALRGDGEQYMLLSAGVVAIIAAIVWVIAAIKRAGVEIAVTDHRVIYKRGILSRHTIEMNRSKIESVDVDQSILGRILGYGTIIVRGTGGSLEPVAMISDPLAFRSHITATAEAS